ncbi:hypothetical protein BJ875DRAFT_209315 [Amylocarpus encephaloides]|uniref:Uncharacterized protein n=1 Tax=Amylocarpus encephaloides TaxID=45428 RepID=A0A9P7YNC3_9HELO|nr:hypothetical protein BJ875DRAFT_209315 [Amylocarpus encephaloides]
MSKSPNSPTPKFENLDHNVLQDGIPPPSAPALAPASSIRNMSPTSRSSSRRRKAAPAYALTHLQALPEIRPIPWILGRELPPEKSTNSSRPQTKGAFMLLTRGEIKNPPCTHCTTGAGRFSACVALDPFYFGACATCQMATRGHLCSLRSDEDGSCR